MEMGSCSMTDSEGSSSSSPPNSATESLNGLKFGQKIYLVDVGSAVPPKLAAGSSSSSCATPPKKVRGGTVQSGEPPRCQVEGCLVDLSDAKAYYSRHKVCGMHSKYPKVIVSGLEQRFCQQCSRFHQLPEFDQGKRSCRRRLAGHNERRRKPPPGSLLSPCYGRLSPSIFENSSRSGSFVMDFSTYPTRFAGNEVWPTTRTVEHVSGNQTAASTGKFLSHPWHSSSCNSQSDLFLQSPAGGTSSSGIPLGECISGIPESNCALSLLSNQPWGSRNRSPGLMVHHFTNTECPPVAPPAAPHSGTTNHFLTPSWGFKDNEAGNNSQELLSNLGLGQISQPLTSQFSSELNASQQNRRQYMELEHSNDFDSSTQHINWSL